MYNPRYQSHRPFLCIDVVSIPNRGVKTERKGWGEDPQNWQNVEQSYVVDRITDKIVRRATVIIDLLEDAMVKNRLKGEGTVDNAEFMKHYKTKYSDKVSQAMDIWSMRKRIAEMTA